MARKSMLSRSDADSSAELRAIFGQHVRARRAKAKWTQSELSKRSGITQEDVSRIENGQLNLTIQTMSRLAEVLDGSVAEMLGRRPCDPEA
jgi:transcriptional regulator with XRE-family HTH domain